MAKWSMRAQVIDTGVTVMGNDFIKFNAVKVVMPDGRRKFLGKVMMHNEIENIFTETQGSFVDLYFCGSPQADGLSLIYGIKTDKEDSYRKDNPNAGQAGLGYIIFLIGMFFLTIGIGFFICALAMLMIWWGRLLKPPSRKFFDSHNVDMHGGDTLKQKVGRQTSATPA